MYLYATTKESGASTKIAHYQFMFNIAIHYVAAIQENIITYKLVMVH